METRHFYDRGADLGIHEDDAGRLELHLSDSGCSCCQSDAYLEGMEMLEALDWHAQKFHEKAKWYEGAAALIREHGETRIADAFMRTGEAASLINVASSLADYAAGEIEGSYYASLSKDFESPRAAAQDYLTRGIQKYGTLDTLDKMIVEFFEPSTLRYMAERIGRLAGHGYNITGYPVEEIQNE